MEPKDPRKLGLSPAGKIRSRVRNLAIILGIGGMLVVAAVFSVLQSEETMGSSYPVSDDQDQDDIPNWEDYDDDNDGIPDSVECGYIMIDPFVNGGFEDPDYINGYSYLNHDDVPGWTTTATDERIEFWSYTGNSFFTVHPSEGDQFAELNATQVSTLYQEMSFNGAGGTLSWSLKHRGRSGVDVANVKIGPTLNTAVTQVTMSDGNTAWGSYSGTYTVAPGVEKLTFAFESVSSVGGNSYGNFIDDIVITLTQDCMDTDGDGLINSLDLDSDGDGIADILEAGGVDSDGDGQVDYPTPGDPMSMIDTDGDGLADAVDDVDSGSGGSEVTSGTPWGLPNTDGMGKPDYLDIDADDDGIVDNTEAQSTSGYIAPAGADTDGDGIDDAYDSDCQPCGVVTGVSIVPVNTGNDPKADYMDSDSDGDGLPDSIEGHDTNGDGIVDGNDSPSANTGTSDGLTDSDGDGLLDGYDNDSDPANFDATNGSLSANSHPDFQGITSERDWREKSTLPVEWLSFEATQQGVNARLDWSTATESNSDYFQIERSADGRIFEVLGEVRAAGISMSQSDYSFTDAGILVGEGTTLLYRLKQVDIDGRFNYSKVVELEIGESSSYLTLSAFPNPVHDVLNLRIEYQGSAFVKIVNATGQAVFESELDPMNTLREFKIPVGDWSPGIYSISATGSNGQKSQQIVVN